MKIGYNGRFLSKIYTGLGQHTLRLLQSLARIDKKNEYYIFVPTDNIVELNLPENFSIQILPQKYEFLGAGMAKFIWEQLTVPAAAEKLKIDLLHNPYDTAPFFKQPFATISTVHDIIPWKLPDYRRKFGTKLRLMANTRSLRIVDRLLSVSITAKLDIAALLDIDYDKIIVVPNGKAEIFKPELTIERRDAVAKRYNIDSPFAFFIGGFDKRKNVQKLIEAFAVIKKRFPQRDLKLVIGGAPNDNTQLFFDIGTLSIVAGNLGIKDDVKFIGTVTDEDLQALYCMCSCFVYPSLYEGFGIPVLEAFTCFAPVVTSISGSIVELAKNGAVLTNPFSAESIADSILEVLDDENLSAKLSGLGHEISKQYNWEDIAQTTLNIYNETVKDFQTSNVQNKKVKS